MHTKLDLPKIHHHTLFKLYYIHEIVVLCYLCVGDPDRGEAEAREGGRPAGCCCCWCS